MKLIKLIIVIFFIIILFNPAGLAKLTSAGDFLLLGTGGATANALGEAYISVANDIRSIYWNPAGLYEINSLQINFLHNRLFSDITINNIGVALPFEYFTLGAALTYLNYGDIKRTTMNDTMGLSGSDFEANSQLLKICSAVSLGGLINTGLTLNIGKTKLDNTSAGIFSADIGLKKKFLAGLINTGLLITNVTGSKIKFINRQETLPGIIKLGGSIKLYEEIFLLSADYIKPSDDKAYIVFGGAINIWDITINTGYKNMKGLKSKTRTGIDMHLQYLTFSYCWIPSSDLGNIHQLEIIYKK